jgi:hypothetical protein
MCECGCGTYRGGFSLPGPNGSLYVLEYYPSCPDCSTPAGIRVNRWDPLPGDDENAQDYAAFLRDEGKVQLLMRQEQPHQHIGYLPVVEPEAVFDEIKREVEGMNVEPEDAGQPVGKLLDLLDREIRDGIRASVRKTIEKAEKS